MPYVRTGDYWVMPDMTMQVVGLAIIAHAPNRSIAESINIIRKDCPT